MEQPYYNKKRVWGPHTTINHPFSAAKEEAGYMTVFGALLFLVMASFLYVCIDASLIYQAKARCVMAQSGLGEHLLANYNKPLAEKYNLYFLDPALGKENLETRAADYYETLFATAGANGFTKSLWQLQEQETQIELFGTMQEEECAYFKEQIGECMKYSATKDVLLKMFDAATREITGHSSQMENTIEELEQQETGQEGLDAAGDTLLPSESAVQGSSHGGTEVSNPLKKIKNMLEYGILGCVTAVEQLSKHTIDSASLPFKNRKSNGLKISMDILKNLDDIKEMIVGQNLGQLKEGIIDRSMLSLYLGEYFGCYGETSDKESGLLYEGEYVLGGYDSDKENMEYVVNRLVLFRFCMNAAYAFSDVTLNEQAYTLAAGITGLAGMPELVEVARVLILAAVSMIESVSDVEDLLADQTVPIMKTVASWKTAIGGDVIKTGMSEEGLAYKEYLMILVLLDSDENNICLRMQNLMQLYVQEKEPEFEITRCMSGLKITSKIAVQTIFSGREYIVEEAGIYEY